MYTLLVNQNAEVLHYFPQRVTPHTCADLLAGEHLHTDRPFPREWEANDRDMWVKHNLNGKTDLLTVRHFDETSIKPQAYHYIYVIQFRGYLGWEDCAEYNYNDFRAYDPTLAKTDRKNAAHKSALKDLREYRASKTGTYKLITRRVLLGE